MIRLIQRCKSNLHLGEILLPTHISPVCVISATALTAARCSARYSSRASPAPTRQRVRLQSVSLSSSSATNINSFALGSIDRITGRVRSSNSAGDGIVLEENASPYGSIGVSSSGSPNEEGGKVATISGIYSPEDEGKCWNERSVGSSKFLRVQVTDGDLERFYFGNGDNTCRLCLEVVAPKNQSHHVFGGVGGRGGLFHGGREVVFDELLQKAFQGFQPAQVVRSWAHILMQRPEYPRLRALLPQDVSDLTARGTAVRNILLWLMQAGVINVSLKPHAVQTSDPLQCKFNIKTRLAFERWEALGDSMWSSQGATRMCHIFTSFQWAEGKNPHSYSVFRELIETNANIERVFDTCRLSLLLNPQVRDLVKDGKMKADIVEALFGELHFYILARENGVMETGMADPDNACEVNGEGFVHVLAVVKHVMHELYDLCVLCQAHVFARGAAPLAGEVALRRHMVSLRPLIDIGDEICFRRPHFDPSYVPPRANVVQSLLMKKPRTVEQFATSLNKHLLGARKKYSTSLSNNSAESIDALNARLFGPGYNASKCRPTVRSVAWPWLEGISHTFQQFDGNHDSDSKQTISHLVEPPSLRTAQAHFKKGYLGDVTGSPSARSDVADVALSNHDRLCDILTTDQPCKVRGAFEAPTHSRLARRPQLHPPLCDTPSPEDGDVRSKESALLPLIRGESIRLSQSDDMENRRLEAYLNTLPTADTSVMVSAYHKSAQLCPFPISSKSPVPKFPYKLSTDAWAARWTSGLGERLFPSSCAAVSIAQRDASMQYRYHNKNKANPQTVEPCHELDLLGADADSLVYWQDLLGQLKERLSYAEGIPLEQWCALADGAAGGADSGGQKKRIGGTCDFDEIRRRNRARQAAANAPHQHRRHS